jgi:hypothetical protein
MNKLRKTSSSNRRLLGTYRVVYNKPLDGSIAWCDCKVYKGQKACPEFFAEVINLDLLEPNNKTPITKDEIMSWSKFE